MYLYVQSTVEDTRVVLSCLSFWAMLQGTSTHRPQCTSVVDLIIDQGVGRWEYTWCCFFQTTFTLLPVVNDCFCYTILANSKKCHNFFHLVCTKWNLFIICNSLIAGHLVFFIREMPIEGFFSLLYWVIFLSFIHGHYSYIWDPNPL